MVGGLAGFDLLGSLSSSAVYVVSCCNLEGDVARPSRRPALQSIADPVAYRKQEVYGSRARKVAKDMALDKKCQSGGC